MHVLFIKNYKKKLVIFSSLAVLLISAVIFLNLVLGSGLFFKVTINEYLTFNYPLEFEVDNIYVNELFADEAVITGSSFDKPMTTNFTKYESIQGNFSFLYPSIFNLSQHDFLGSDILYHIDFQNKEATTHGFVQVWNMPYSLEEFLSQSKKTSMLDYQHFESKPIKVNDIPGFSWDYTFIGHDGKGQKGIEVFLKKNDKMYRMSYFTPENLWNKKQSEIFWEMVKSFEIH